MEKYDLETEGAHLSVYDGNLLITFDRPRCALSTAIYGGGFQHIKYALNRQLMEFYPSEKDFPGGSVEAYLGLCAEKCGAAPGESSVLLTSADINYYAHKIIRAGSLLIETVATGGVVETACRASSAPLYREEKGVFGPVGTINLMVMMNGKLPDGIMARALITLTEGKTAALEDLGIADVNNGKPATGTSTDGITFITDPEGPLYTDAGTFSELGASLARAAYESVIECIRIYGYTWNISPLLVTPSAIDIEPLKARYKERNRIRNREMRKQKQSIKE